MAAVRISVESFQECQVQEIAYDGQETYSQPLSLSENLSKLANKIDFSKTNQPDEGENGEGGLEKDSHPDGDVDKEEAEEGSADSPQEKWPWEAVRDKIRAALTEVHVLHDVLSIAKEKKFMVLDRVSQEPLQSRPNIQLLAKKKAFHSAAMILVRGAKVLFRSQQESTARRSRHLDFHSQLLKIRQKWRLRKAGSALLGDLNFRADGSRYAHSGTFEVTKSVEMQGGSFSESPGNSRPLEITLPVDLEGAAYICVTIQEENGRLQEVKLRPGVGEVRGGDPGEGQLLPPVPPTAHWQHRLEAAQNVLFCKEIFAQISRDAVQEKAAIPHMVVSKQIKSSIFPGVFLTISLIHNNSNSTTDEAEMRSPPPCENKVLEHSLHQLLREVHKSNIGQSMPHPITGAVGVTKRRRLAGPTASSKRDLDTLQQRESLLEKILKQAQHSVLRLRLAQCIDEVSREVVDPCVQAHWSIHTTRYQSVVKLLVAAHGYEQMCKTSIQFLVGTDQVRAVFKDGRSTMLSHERQELKGFLLSQVKHHLVSTVQNLCKMMGWQVLQSSQHVGAGPMETLGTPSSLMAASPSGDRVLAVRSGMDSGLQVCVQVPKNQQSGSAAPRPKSDLVTDTRWENLGCGWREVYLAHLPGRNFAQKIELLMASLMQS